jgi:hypothetical protein
MSTPAAETESGTSTPREGSPPPIKKKFHNGWTKELENLFADWADKAACYRWMHERTERIFRGKDQSLMFPIIILSTVTGAANFALDSVIEDPEYKKYAQLGLGGLSILTGILTTIANRLGYASGSEAHKLAAVSWGKFNRFIVIELALHPDERMESFSFMKMFRTELDRLIEQSPSIPEAVISSFIHEFKNYKDVKKPEIAGELEHTRIFKASDERLKRIAQEAALTLAQKKGVLKQLVLDDLDTKVRRLAEDSARKYMEEQKKAVSLAAVAGALAGPKGAPKNFAERQKAERQTELKSLAQNNVVAEMKARFLAGKTGAGESPSTASGSPKPEQLERGRSMLRRASEVVNRSRAPSVAASVANSVASGVTIRTTTAPVPTDEFIISFESPPPVTSGVPAVSEESPEAADSTEEEQKREEDV